MQNSIEKHRKPTPRRRAARQGVVSAGNHRKDRHSADVRETIPARPRAESADTAEAGGLPITRRQLIVGAAGITAAALVGGGAFALASSAGAGSSAEASEGALSFPEEAVFTTEQCEYLDDPKQVLSLRTRASLPFGTTLTSCSDGIAACLMPTKTTDPLLQVGLLHLGSGNLTTALKASVGAEDGFQILDARANEAGLVWLESNMLSGDWRVYSATVNGAEVGEPTLAAEGNSAWTLPALTVSGGYGWWQTSPKEDGSSTSTAASDEETDQPVICRVSFGGAQQDVQTVLVSPGGFACAPAPATSGIVCAQKTSARGKTWQLIYLAEESGQVEDRLTLPSTMKPMDVSYGPNGFGFAFDSIYRSNDGMANLGTYVPAEQVSLTTAAATEDALKGIEESLSSSKDESLTDADKAKAALQGENAVCDLYNAAPWFRFPRTPVSSPAFSGDTVFVKSTNVIAAVNLGARTYTTIPTESATQGYGEYLASSGTVGRIVTFANVDYTPMSGERINECTVRVWEPM